MTVLTTCNIYPTDCTHSWQYLPNRLYSQHAVFSQQTVLAACSIFPTDCTHSLQCFPYRLYPQHAVISQQTVLTQTVVWRILAAQRITHRCLNHSNPQTSCTQFPKHSTRQTVTPYCSATEVFVKKGNQFVSKEFADGRQRWWKTQRTAPRRVLSG
jgi:hypothetical protein